LISALIVGYDRRTKRKCTLGMTSETAEGVVCDERKIRLTRVGPSLLPTVIYRRPPICIIRLPRVRSPALRARAYVCVRIPSYGPRTCIDGREGGAPRSSVHVHRPCYFYEWLAGYVIPTRATTTCIRVT